MTRRIWFIIAFLLLAWSGAASAQADSCEAFYSEKIKPQAFDGAWAFSAIHASATPSGCILGEQDTSAIAPLYKSLFVNKDLDRLSISVKQQEIIDRVLEDLASLASGRCSAANPAGCLIERQTGKVLALRATLDSAVTNPATPNPLLVQDNWVVKNDGLQRVTGDNISAYVAAQCRVNLATTECRNGVLYAAKLIRSGEAMAQLVTHYQLPLIGQNKQFLTARDKQWDQYFNEVSVQYPWELAVNSWWYTRSKTREELAGFPEAPTSKFVALHPSVGYERIDTPIQKDSLEGAVLIELLGYERWQWKNGEAKNRWGGSVVASYADINGMDSVGYGLVLHTPVRNTSIGVIWRDGDQGDEMGIFINIDLAKLINQYNDIDLATFLAR